jgi:hypothetical protein
MRSAWRALSRLQVAFDHSIPCSCAPAAAALQEWRTRLPGSGCSSSGARPPRHAPASAAGFSSSGAVGAHGAHTSSSQGPDGNRGCSIGSRQEANAAASSSGGEVPRPALSAEAAAMRQSLLGGKRFYETVRVEAAPGQPVRLLKGVSCPCHWQLPGAWQPGLGSARGQALSAIAGRWGCLISCTLTHPLPSFCAGTAALGP